MEGAMRLWMVPFLVLVSMVAAQTVYLWDDWGDGDANGWVELATAASYEVTDSLTYRFSYDGSGDEFGLSYWGMAMPDPDYMILGEFVAHTPTTHVGFYARYDPTSELSYSAYADYNSDDLSICKRTPDFSVVSHVSYDFMYLQRYCLKFAVYGTSLMAKVWQYGESEPDWMIQTTDGDITAAQHVGLEVMNIPNGSFAGDFYYVMVADSIPNALDQNTWGQIKTVF
jgi:hypothetical protein